jgi:hypothetical protein
VKIHRTGKSECAEKSYPKTLPQPYTMLLPVWPPNLLAREGSKIHTFECSVLGLQYKMLYMIIKGRGFKKLSKYLTHNTEISTRKLCTIHKKFVQNSNSSNVRVAHASVCGVYHPCLAPPGWDKD